jgi:hypothetical protein
MKGLDKGGQSLTSGCCAEEEEEEEEEEEDRSLIYTLPIFTIVHTLGFPVSTSHLLATGLNTQTTTVSPDYALQILHIKSSLHRSIFHNSHRELT